MNSNEQNLLSLRQIQMVGLDMLRYFDRLCSERGLRYFLSGGTLLGAVRHQGFIPWDDDVDVMMPRPDYNRLCEWMDGHRDGRYLILQTGEHTDYATPYLRVLDTRTHVIPTEYMRHSVPHLFLDVFPIEGLPDDERTCLRFYRKMRAYDVMYQSSKKAQFQPGERLQALKKLFIGLARRTGGTAAWARRFNKAAQKTPFGQTKHAGVCVIAHYGARERMPLDVFSESVPVTFEGQTFPAPKGYDVYLRNLYGNYMQLPPEEKRFSAHRLRCWQEEE